MSSSVSIAMVMDGPGAPLRPDTRGIPQPAAGEALVRVRSSSMNYHDLVNLMGLISGPWPRVPMTDGAGEVVAVGPGVEGLAIGDRVLSSFHPLWLSGRPTPSGKRETPGDRSDGWLQQYRLEAAASLIATPAHLSDAEAGTLTCAGTTAWSALEEGGIGAGAVVVTQGTGGVSLLTLQLAKARGATVILTSSSDEKLVIGRSLGADHVINYRTNPDWDREVQAITEGRGADLVVDIGGTDTLGRSVRAVRMDGTVAIVGVLGGFGDAAIPVSTAMLHNVHLVGITVGSVQAQRAMCDAIAESGCKPHISHQLAWDAVPEAMRIMQANEHVGKIALTIP